MKKDYIDSNSLAHTKWNCKYHIVFAPKIQKEGVFRGEKARDTRDITPTMPVEGSGNSRGRSMPGSHPYAGMHPAQNEHFEFHGVLKR